ncbi:hypothetical protein QYM36_018496, partial [Artemia franciscana]
LDIPIDTEFQPPKQFRIPYQMALVLEEQIQAMLQSGIIKEESSQFPSLISCNYARIDINGNCLMSLLVPDDELCLSIVSSVEHLRRNFGLIDTIIRSPNYELLTRSTLEFWTSHRYHVLKEGLDHGGIQMVAIIDRQQFDNEGKVVYVDNVNKLSSFAFATPEGFSLSCVISPFTLKITGEFEGYASLVKQIAGTENLFLEIDILKQQAFEQGLHDGIRRFIRERGAWAVEITVQTSMLGRITVPQIEEISGEDILEDFRLLVSIRGKTEGIATEGTLDKIFKKVVFCASLIHITLPVVK